MRIATAVLIAVWVTGVVFTTSAADPDPKSVARAIVTTNVVDREPVDSIDTLGNDRLDVFFFTEIQNLEGQMLTHRWEYGGEVMAEVPLQIGGPRWRTFSSKRLHESWLGEWTVSVVDEAGRVLESARFDYVEAVPAAAAP